MIDTTDWSHPVARRLITTNQLAERLCTVPSTIRYWRHKGYGPQGIKVGRKVLYDETVVEQWLDSLESRGRSA